MAEVIGVRKALGVAGQVSYTATVQHHGEEKTDTVTFVGSAYGGPVVMVLPSGMQSFVSDPGRFGEFGEQWVRRFCEEVE